MRAIAIIAFAGLIAAARPVSAEPQAAPGGKSQTDSKKQPEKESATKGRAAPAPAPARPGMGLGSLAAMAASAAEAPAKVDQGKVEARRLDLTPQRQLQSGPRADRRGGERGGGIALPDDTDWKVQAVEIGAMTALFGTLVAVCGNGRCLLPEVFGGGADEIGPPADLQIRAEPKLRDPR